MPDGARPTILAVDDNDAIRYSLTRYLREGAMRSSRLAPAQRQLNWRVLNRLSSPSTSTCRIWMVLKFVAG